MDMRSFLVIIGVFCFTQLHSQCPGDVDGNGTVNVSDQLLLNSVYGSECDSIDIIPCWQNYISETSGSLPITNTSIVVYPDGTYQYLTETSLEFHCWWLYAGIVIFEGTDITEVSLVQDLICSGAFVLELVVCCRGRYWYRGEATYIGLQTSADECCGVSFDEVTLAEEEMFLPIAISNYSQFQFLIIP